LGTYTAQYYIPFNEDWFNTAVGDSLAFNPATAPGPLSVEIDMAALNSTYFPTLTVKELVSDDLDAPSAGIITWEGITPVVAGAAFTIEKEALKPRGDLIQLSIYLNSAASAPAFTNLSLFYGPDDKLAWDDVSANQNADYLARKGLTPGASGRTAGIYDYVAVRGDALANALPIGDYRSVKAKVTAATAMSGSLPIVVARLEQWGKF
jgi:hypothetical protein